MLGKRNQQQVEEAVCESDQQVLQWVQAKLYDDLKQKVGNERQPYKKNALFGGTLSESIDTDRHV